MLRYYSSAEYHAGDFKTVPNTVVETDSVTGRQRTVLKTADPGIATETAMADLVSWYNEEVDANAATIAVAVEFVFRFLAIHPFQDGNGRLSRLLFHAALMAPKESPFRQSAPLCAIDRAIERSRSTYYRVLQRCSGGVFNADPAAYEYAHFLDYMVDVLAESQKNFSHYCEKFDRFQGLSDTALRILECFRDAPEHLMTTGMLIERTSVPRRTVIYSLNSLVAAGFVQSLGSGAGRRYRLVF
jgi:Fic family protein